MADIAFPDVELLLCNELADQLDDVAVYAGTTPVELPPKSVTVIRTGGQYRDFVLDEARVSIDCRANSTPGTALNLISEVRRLILVTLKDTGISMNPPIYNTNELGGPYLNPDPRNHNFHRYTMLVSVLVRATQPNK